MESRSLRIDARCFARVINHLRAAAPLEAVGLLACQTDGAGDQRVTQFYPGTNVDASPTRYTMDPAEVLAALNDIEAHGWRLGAIVHSHPASPPTPSATDLREAFYPEALLVIVGLAASPPSARVWRIIPRDGVGSAVVEVPLIVDGEA